MAKATKTVAVQQEVVRIPDAELVRQLRIDRSAKLWPGVPKVDALLRQYDSALEYGLRQVVTLVETQDKLSSYANDLAALEQERIATTAANTSLAEQIRKLADFILEVVPGEPSENEGAVDCAIRLLRSVYTARAAEVPVIAEFHATSLPATLPPHCGSALRIVPAAPIGATNAL